MAAPRPFPFSQEVLRLTYRYDAETGAFSFFNGTPVSIKFSSGAHCQVYVSEDVGHVSLGRLLWKYVHGTEPEVVAVIGDPMDWRISNFQAMTRSERSAMTRRDQLAGVPRKNRPHSEPRGCRGTSAHPGVSWVSLQKRWTAHVRVNGKRKNLGFWLREEDAAAAVRAHKAGTQAPVAPEPRGMSRLGKGTGVTFHSKEKKWIARAPRNKHLGRFATKEEAIAARKKWEEENGAA